MGGGGAGVAVLTGAGTRVVGRAVGERVGEGIGDGTRVGDGIGVGGTDVKVGRTVVRVGIGVNVGVGLARAIKSAVRQPRTMNKKMPPNANHRIGSCCFNDLPSAKKSRSDRSMIQPYNSMIPFDRKTIQLNRFIGIGNVRFVNARIVELFFGGINVFQIGQEQTTLPRIA